MKLKLNVYPIIDDLEQKIVDILNLAIEKRAKEVEIAYGQASENTKKRIVNCLMQKDIRKLYHRLEKTSKGWGRIYVYFRWK